MSRRSTAPAHPPWWSEPGPEQCAFCLQAYYAEMGYYCFDCDRAVCPVCVVQLREQGSVHCPECHGQGQD